jgi:glycosyltransferase involved in cell wall biosynthesis
MTTISEKIPTLVTNVGGLPEPLKLAKIGWIIEDDINEANLQAALLNILHNPEEIRKIKQDENAWRKVQDYYDWHNISLQTQGLYNKIIYN